MKSIVSVILFMMIPSVSFASDKYEQFLTLLGFKLENANLINIREKLGEAPINHSGDAGGSYYGLCYVLPKHNVTVYCGAGEMGGKSHDLSSFVVKNSIERKLKCGVLANTNLAEAKVGILEIGKNIESVKIKLPQPISNKPYGLQHKNFGQRPFSEADIKMTQVEDMKSAFWDVFTSIDVYTQNGLVSGYKVSRLTSW